MSTETETPLETETEATETQAQAERPEWLPSQFATPEMLAKSWKEASRKISQQGTQLSELARENEALASEVESLLAERDAFEERIGTLEQGLLRRLVSRRGAV